MCYWVQSSILLRMRINCKLNTRRAREGFSLTCLLIEVCLFYFSQLIIIQRFEKNHTYFLQACILSVEHRSCYNQNSCLKLRPPERLFDIFMSVYVWKLTERPGKVNEWHSYAIQSSFSYILVTVQLTEWQRLIMCIW